MNSLSKILCCGLVCLVGSGVQGMKNVGVTQEREYELKNTFSCYQQSLPTPTNLQMGYAAVATILEKNPSNADELNVIFKGAFIRNANDKREGTWIRGPWLNQRLDGTKFFLYFLADAPEIAGMDGCIRIKTDENRQKVYMFDGFEFVQINGYLANVIKEVLEKNEGDHDLPLKRYVFDNGIGKSCHSD